MVRLLALLLGPCLAVLVYGLVPDSFLDPEGNSVELGHAGRLVAALASWMAVWWMTEAIPVYATALLPLAVLPLGKESQISTVAAPYAHELIFLFLGGFILAFAMQKHNLHRRIALNTLHRFGVRPWSMVGGFMLISAGLSMWVSNTATAMMLMPIAISLLEVVDNAPSYAPRDRQRLSVCLLLAIAYAASIGGLATPIGSPPNGFAIGFLGEQLDVSIGFLSWMLATGPLVVSLLLLTWCLLVLVLFRLSVQPIDGGREYVETELRGLGPTKFAEWVILIVFVATAIGWILRPTLNQWQVRGELPLEGLSDAGLAIAAALILFIVPDRGRGKRVMDWEATRGLPWGLLLLFGGGLSLAAAISRSGLSEFLGSQVARFAGSPDWVIALAVIVLVVFLTEVTSNIATVAALVPVLAAIAQGMEVPPLALVIPAALAGSCAFMLPVATPPNAIVYGTGRVSIRQMMIAGLALNAISILCLQITVMIWLPWVLEMGAG